MGNKGSALFLVSLSPLDFLSKPLQRGIAFHQVRLRVAVPKLDGASLIAPSALNDGCRLSSSQSATVVIPNPASLAKSACDQPNSPLAARTRFGVIQSVRLVSLVRHSYIPVRPPIGFGGSVTNIA